MLIGLFGKANVGKSTFFNAATDLSLPIANFPFTTISPNIGIAFIAVNCVCKDLSLVDNPVNSTCVHGIRYIPVKLIDIAGLVPGAYSGRGLGNKFLDDARQADVLIHVVDISGSTNSEGHPVDSGQGNPLNDIEFVEHEFDLWIRSIILRDWDKIIRESENLKQSIETVLSKRLSGLSINETIIKNSINLIKLLKKPAEWTENDLLSLSRQIRISSKPIIIAANKADLPHSDQNIDKLKTLKRPFFPVSAEAELVLRRAKNKNLIDYLPGASNFNIKDDQSLSKNQINALNVISNFLDKYGSTGVQNVLNYSCINVLQRIVVYPVEDEFKLTDKKGNVLPDARIVPNHITPKDLAYQIHQDLGDGYLYAIDARTKQRIGADHILKSNDIVKIVSAMGRL